MIQPLARDRRTLLWLFGLLLLPLAGLGHVPLFDLDEGAFTASTTEMFLRHDFLSTWLMGVPRYDKPVLSYWLQAGSVALFGSPEWAFRLPSALAASAWIGLTFAFARRVAAATRTPAAANEFALLAALLVATTLGPGIIQRAATADAWLNLWLVAAAYANWLWLCERQARWQYLGFAAMALGFLTKGPVAVVVPAGALGLYLLSQRRLSEFWRWAFNWRAIALFLLIAAPWFVVQAWVEGPGFLLNFFFRHNLGRYASAMEGHRGQVWFYLPVVLLSLLPHTGLLLRALRAPRALWQDDLSRYGLLWFALVLVIFSTAGTKLPHYIYYGYGGLWLVLAGQLDARCSRHWVLWPALLRLALMALAPGLVAARVPAMKPDEQRLLSGLAESFGRGYYLALGALLLAGFAALLRWRRPIFQLAYGTGVACSLAVMLLLAPAVGEVQQGPIRAAGLLAATRTEPLVMFGLNKPSFQTYAGRAVERRTPVAGDLALVREARLAELPGAEVIFRQRSYVLALMP